VTVDTAAPTVDGAAPQDGATEVALAASVEATFSEAMDPATLDPTTFTLVEQGSGTSIGGTVTYDGTTKVVTLDSDTDLHASATYTATVSTGDRNAAGNPLATDTAWSLTTAASVSCEPGTLTVPTRSRRGQW
jgi:Bacterial Ig-like domain